MLYNSEYMDLQKYLYSIEIKDLEQCEMWCFSSHAVFLYRYIRYILDNM